MSEPEYEEEEVGSLPAWISPWGGAAFLVTTLAVVQAHLMGIWILTLALAALGSLVVFLGFRATEEVRQTRDKVWLAMAGALSGVVLVLTVFAPGILYSRWAIDTPVARSNPNEMVLVPREKQGEKGSPLSPEEWVDAATEGIRQDDMFIRVESVKIGPLQGTTGPPRLQIHLRLANTKTETITVPGFDSSERRPVLTDDSGRSYEFLEQRRRRPARGAPVFEAPGPQPGELLPNSNLDHLLVFSAPPSGFVPLKLTVPTSAWGRKGECKFRISQPLVAPGPKKGDSKL